MTADRGIPTPLTAEALLQQIGISPLPTDLLPETTLAGDLGLDPLHLVELAYLCDDLVAGQQVADDSPFFDTVSELAAFLATLPDRG